MSQLKEMGIGVKRTKKSSSTDVSGVQLSSSETTEFTLTLPRPAGVSASFSREGLGKKIAKLFKKELQTGDAEFDRTVYISTDTPTATAELLKSDELRAAIALTISTAGPIEIHDTVVRVEVVGHQDGDDPAVVTIARALLP